MRGFDRLAEAMCRAGWCDLHIAAVLGCNLGLVKRLREMRGWQNATEPRTVATSITPSMIEQINDLRMDGRTAEWIAWKLRVSRMTVFRHTRRELKGNIRVVSRAMRQRMASGRLPVGGWSLLLRNPICDLSIWLH